MFVMHSSRLGDIRTCIDSLFNQIGLQKKNPMLLRTNVKSTGLILRTLALNQCQSIVDILELIKPEGGKPEQPSFERTQDKF
jgi:hypothetical protein